MAVAGNQACPETDRQGEAGRGMVLLYSSAVVQPLEALQRARVAGKERHGGAARSHLLCLQYTTVQYSILSSETVHRLYI